ncbi:hypothetical protein HZS38_00035 [Xenorhabdus nematophila]|uniref:restriction endonuclease fold toxin 5 domain-containing protein n=1 Tax=Xenorhabdus nematophila TaxID=628 RepID=UPI000543D51F|nr:restriction endonuclease fold toxin 5 domain-containing protein [Xenorhabdus nematophila]CEF33477.1 conserved exported hypothetical protein [Xenorhabdus nematophila str. Websteri]AYA39116.1 hypothetical protein D3790_00155 [Xenorhabdus nematophila]KHD27481.1 hypothetical protein LH67_17825 [Xenorhabdus nematophila]MBA0017700.1 hypothetical protein [Xenorhabdus nematophila]MCB4426667.1 hypothetical protein [Xenorhabdus nematophila]
MPGPLVFGAPAAGAALLAAAEWTLAACVTGLVAVGIMEGTKDNTDEKDKAEADTKVITSSRTECEKCPAIGKVTMVWESTNGRSDIAINYQAAIAKTIYDPALSRIETWECGKVNFDGWQPVNCLFLEAKANYDQFFKDGEPKWFYAEFRKKPTDKTGLESMEWQAKRQSLLCIQFNNIPKSHWHFLQPVSYGYFAKIFAKLPNIKTFFTPRP